MTNSKYKSKILSILILILIFSYQSISASTDCPYGGKQVSKTQLHFIISNHKELIDKYTDQIDDADGNLSKIRALKKLLKIDPRYANLCSANLIYLDFSGANLYAANFDNALLGNSNFEYSNLSDASFVKANLSHASLSNANFSRANFKDANLYRAKLINSILYAANLSHADLSNSHLQEIKLNDANLAGANFTSAILTNAYMSYSNLISAQFKHADLTNAILKDADLTYASFIDTNLTNVELHGALVSKTDFENANLQGINYLPELGSYPHMGNLSQNKSLHLLTFKHNASGLYQLRNRFKKLGFRDAERKVTYAIRHTERYLNNKIGFIKHVDDYFSYVFFEFPTDWSMHPEKALFILIILLLVFTLPYSLSIYIPSADGIWMRWNNKRIRQDRGHNDAKLLSAGLFKSILIGFQFSIISAFQIGWKDLNVGSWISSIQPREYSLYPTGWVRTVAGIQSLLSVYLIGAWALTYFGRPFE